MWTYLKQLLISLQYDVKKSRYMVLVRLLLELLVNCIYNLGTLIIPALVYNTELTKPFSGKTLDLLKRCLKTFNYCFLPVETAYWFCFLECANLTVNCEPCVTNVTPTDYPRSKFKHWQKMKKTMTTFHWIPFVFYAERKFNFSFNQLHLEMHGIDTLPLKMPQLDWLAWKNINLCHTDHEWSLKKNWNFSLSLN